MKNKLLSATLICFTSLIFGFSTIDAAKPSNTIQPMKQCEVSVCPCGKYLKKACHPAKGCSEGCVSINQL